MEILITNDDGIYAEGIYALATAMRKVGNVTVVAPDTQRSAVGHAITITDPLRVTEAKRNGKFFGYAASGTPADCVKLGIKSIMKKRPDLVVSGINLGGNLGYNVLYSGTVSGATEGALLGIPSMAISLNTFIKPDFSAAAAFAVARGEEIYRVSFGGGLFETVKSSMPVAYTVREASGTLKSSLWEAMSAEGLPPALIMEFADVFAWEIDFLTEPRKGDRFALVWEEGVSALGRRTGLRVKAAAYSGEQAGEARGYYHGGGYYNGKGNSLRRAFLRAPLSYRRISSYFSKARFHPILRRYRAHNGIDYAAPSGTPVSAIADGTVSFKGRKGGYGNFLELRHANACVTGYGHLQGFARGLRAGSRVAQGQVIGYVGMTGLATGPHLDFSLKLNGRFTDFLKFRPPSVASLAGEKLAAFKAESAVLAGRLENLLPAAR